MLRLDDQVWGDLADELDPPDPPVELADPVRLAIFHDRRYIVREHLRVIGRAMAHLHQGLYDRLMINQPPQTGKSVTAVEWGAFWFLCLNPATSIVIGSYDTSLALRRGKAIRKLVMRYGAAYGVVIERGSNSQTDWRTTQGGGVRSVGVGSGITGHPGDILFIDDPTKSRKDADSSVRRAAVWDWYSADLLSRQSPGAKIVMVQTPWHIDDLRARVLAQEGEVGKDLNGRWKVVRMPAFADAADDPLGRKPGEPLPHPRLPENLQALDQHWHTMKHAVIERDWFALWQCDPRPQAGTLLSWEMLRERRCYQVGDRDCGEPTAIAVAVDPSGGGRDTAGIIGGYLTAGTKLRFTHDRSGRMASAQWSREACALAAEIGADRIIVEKNYGGDMAALVIRTAWEALRAEDPQKYNEFPPRIVEVSARRNKMLRAEPIAQQWIEDRIGTAAMLLELESEWATWRATDTESPGRIDASTYMAYDLLPVPHFGVDDTDSAIEQLMNTQLWGH